MSNSKSKPVFGSHHSLDAMRYGGYQNPAYALAEVIDNSVEANASMIEVMCKEIMNEDVGRLRMLEIGVLDNGDGMSQNDLWDSLLSGEGTRHTTGSIGRFGVGLLNSSLSQCKRVVVYSWTNPKNIHSVYLDFDESLRTHKLPSVSGPIKDTIPDEWQKQSSSSLPKSGTLVVWSKLDRCVWKKSDTLIINSERLIGRIYRKFINNKKTKIRMMSFNDATSKTNIDKYIVPNDPLYQMIPSSTPSPWDKKTMFQLNGDKWEEVFPMRDQNGKSHDVWIRCAYATKEARKGSQAGAKSHGHHANFNLGVSVMRAERELSLDTNLLQTYNPKERWWGVELEFPTALDDVFGVTNSKQDATSLSAMTKRVGSVSRNELDDFKDFDEESKQMFELAKLLALRIRHMRDTVGKQKEGEGTSKNKRYAGLTEKKEARTKEGHLSITDTNRDTKSQKELEEAYKLDTAGTDEEGESLDPKTRVEFVNANLSGSQFFDVGLDSSVEVIKLNINHNAYKNLIELVSKIPSDIKLEEALRRLHSARRGLESLLASWACFEDEEINPELRKKIADTRYNWSKVLDEYLQDT